MPSKPNPVAMRLRVVCPHCDAPANARTSIQQTPLLREIYYQCTNLLCGCAFVATLETCRIVTPSHTPRPGLCIPMLARGSHLPIFPANDDAASPRNPPQNQPAPNTG